MFQFVLGILIYKMSQNDGNNLEKQKIDLIVIGNQNSGKTSLIKRFVEGSSIT